MAKELMALGYEIDVVTAMPNYPTGRIFDSHRGRFMSTETIDGVNIRRVWVPAAQGRGLSRILSLFGFAALVALPLARSRRPDLVFVNSAPLTFSPVALGFARLRRAPAVLGISDLWPDSLVSAGVLQPGLAMRLMHRVERSMYRRFDALSPVTDGMVEILTSEKGVDEQRLAPLPNGVDCDLFTPAPPGTELRGSNVFAYCGTIGFMHGTQVILDAMDLLKETRPDISVVFVGGGSERARIEQLAMDRGLDRVSFRDPIPPTDLAAYLHTVTAGLVTLEDVEANAHARSAKTLPLMAAGLPVVLSGFGETASLVKAADCGIVAPVADGGALAEAMTAVADDPESCHRWGENGRRYAVEHLSWKSNVADWIGTLRRRGLTT